MPDIELTGTVQEEISVTGKTVEEIPIIKTLDEIFTLDIFFNAFSLSFDGVDDLLNIDSLVTSLAPTTKGTWSMRVKPITATPLDAEIFMNFGDTNANSQIIFFMISDGSLRAGVTVGGAAQWFVDTSASVFSNNIWAQIAIVQNGISPVLYVDGIAVAQGFLIETNKAFWFTGVPGLDNGRIASRNINNAGETNNFQGNIDEVRVWNTDLSSAQMVTHYNSGQPLDPILEPLQSNLITAYRMGDGDLFPTIKDNKSSNDGTMINMDAGDIVADVP